MIRKIYDLLLDRLLLRRVEMRPGFIVVRGRLTKAQVVRLRRHFAKPRTK